MTIEKAIKYFEGEIRFCERSPAGNIVHQNKDWVMILEANKVALEALREKQVREHLSPMKRYNDEVIYLFDGVASACIFVKDTNSITTIPVNMLKWHEPDGDELDKHLTLQEIGEQVRAMYDDPVIYVWVDSPLRGVIYQTGNYSGSDAWIEHGTTMGYA